MFMQYDKIHIIFIKFQDKNLKNTTLVHAAYTEIITSMIILYGIWNIM